MTTRRFSSSGQCNSVSPETADESRSISVLGVSGCMTFRIWLQKSASLWGDHGCCMEQDQMEPAKSSWSAHHSCTNCHLWTLSSVYPQSFASVELGFQEGTLRCI